MTERTVEKPSMRSSKEIKIMKYGWTIDHAKARTCFESLNELKTLLSVPMKGSPFYRGFKY